MGNPSNRPVMFFGASFMELTCGILVAPCPSRNVDADQHAREGFWLRGTKRFITTLGTTFTDKSPTQPFAWRHRVGSSQDKPWTPLGPSRMALRRHHGHALGSWYRPMLGQHHGHAQPWPKRRSAFLQDRP